MQKNVYSHINNGRLFKFRTEIPVNCYNVGQTFLTKYYKNRPNISTMEDYSNFAQKSQ